MTSASIHAYSNTLHCNTKRYLHKLQRRPSYACSLPVFVGCGCQIDGIYLDTTYSHPKHVFPPQETAIQSIVDVIQQTLASERPPNTPPLVPLAPLAASKADAAGETANDGGEELLEGEVRSPEASAAAAAAAADRGEGEADVERIPKRTLFLVSAYTIGEGGEEGPFSLMECVVAWLCVWSGKEKIPLAVAKACGVKIYLEERKVATQPVRQSSLNALPARHLSVWLC